MVSILGIVKVPIYVFHVFIDPDYSKVIENIFWLMVIHNVATESFLYSNVFTFLTFSTMTRIFWAERAEILFRVTTVDIVNKKNNFFQLFQLCRPSHPTGISDASFSCVG